MSLPAHAGLSSDRAGWWAEVAVGSGNGGTPFRPGLGGLVSGGVWLGRYDDNYALGRFWGFGALVRTDWLAASVQHAVRVAPMLEVRRGLDLLVVTLHAGLAAGPLFTHTTADVPVGGTARVSGGVRWRFHSRVGLGARLEAGVDLWPDAPIGATVSLMIGFGGAGPFARPPP